ncbi:MAG: 3'(2'),5'-bisphosphate nucleotidase CysQ [Gemmatimonadota bacterium]
MPDAAVDLRLAVSAARAAGDILLESFGKRLDVDYKRADQPVTEADRAADRFLRRTLLGERPAYGWLAEESGSVEAGASAPVWVVDPLDGTSNFIEDRPEFAVCVGLLDRGTPMLGVVYNPVSGALYSAMRGGEALFGDAPIAVASPPAVPPRLVASWTEMDDGLLERFRPAWRVVTVGSTALKMMSVAEGAADAYVSFGRKEIWDVCAATVIAEAAGADVLDLDGRPLVWHNDFGPLDGLIVVSRSLGADIQEIVRLAKSPGTTPEQGE